MFQKQQPAPGEGRQHQGDPDIVGEMGQAVIVFQPAQHGQDIVPVMPVRFLSHHAAQQHQIQVSRIVDVGGDVHEVFCCPPKGH